MLKRRKKKKLTKKESPKANKKDSEDTSLAKQIEKAVKGLYYISETDAEISPFIGKTAECVSKEEITKQTGNAAGSAIEERNFAEFFERLTQIQDWFGDEEKQTAQKFGQLKRLLENNLRDLKVFKIGKIELDVYAVGLDAENRLMGIKTKAVET